MHLVSWLSSWDPRYPCFAIAREIGTTPTQSSPPLLSPFLLCWLHLHSFLLNPVLRSPLEQAESWSLLKHPAWLHSAKLGFRNLWPFISLPVSSLQISSHGSRFHSPGTSSLPLAAPSLSRTRWPLHWKDQVTHCKAQTCSPLILWGSLPSCLISKRKTWASLVTQWPRILLMQETRVRALILEDPTCLRATKPARLHYRACARAWGRQLRSPRALQPALLSRSSPGRHNREKPTRQWRPAQK